MTDLLNNFNSPSWWLSAVVIAFLINIASDYTKPQIDLLLGFISEKRRKANSINAQQWDSEINEIRVNENIKLLKIAEISNINNRGIFFTLIGLSFFLVGTSSSNFIQFVEPIEASKIGALWGLISLIGRLKILIGFQLLCCILGSFVCVIGASCFNHSKKIYLQIKEAVTKTSRPS